ncbi:MAG: Cell division protein FtsA [Elusimicrobia bacterium ADurb.Bin231]|nr:MAG: Cell division protein FtsA [Elusimicrobia bacterium ADurb.Bin231]
MSKNEILVGLDVGSSKVACAIAKKGSSELPEIIGLSRVPCHEGMNRGVVKNMEAASLAVAQAIEQAEEKADERVSSVIVSIKGDHIESVNKSGEINISRPDTEITDEDIRRVVDATKSIHIPTDREIIQTVLKDFSVDGQKEITNPCGMEGTHLAVNVHLVIGLTSKINNLIKCISNAGAETSKMISSVLAAGEVSISKDEKQIGCVLIDMGAQTTDVAVYFNGHIQGIEEIPLGGDDITKDVAHGLGSSLSVARDVKEKYGSAVTSLIEPKEEVTYLNVDGRTQKTVMRKTLTDYIGPRVDEILKAVNDKISSIKQNKKMLSSGIIITGGGSQLRGMKEACEAVIKLPARIGIPQERFTGTIPGITDPSFTAAIGLVVYRDMFDSENLTSKKFGKSDMGKKVIDVLKKYFE